MKQPDSLDVGTKMDVVRHRLNVAREDLDTANLTFEAGQYRAANNRAYYSIFHTICAVLAKEGVAFKRHKDTLSYFNKNYVQPEIFPRELGRKIVKAEISACYPYGCSRWNFLDTQAGIKWSANPLECVSAA